MKTEQETNEALSHLIEATNEAIFAGRVEQAIGLMTQAISLAYVLNKELILGVAITDDLPELVPTKDKKKGGAK